METWERIARKVKKELANTHILRWNDNNKCARFYRTAYFTGRSKRGPLPSAPYEGKEEILITEEGAIVKKLGLGYYRLNTAMRNALYELGMAPTAKPHPEGLEYYWKIG